MQTQLYRRSLTLHPRARRGQIVPPMLQRERCKIHLNTGMNASVIALWLGIAASPFAVAAAHPSSLSIQQAGSDASAPNDFPPGTAICAQLAKGINAKSAKPGDAIVARVTLPVVNKGKVALPNDTKIMGHVVAANARSKGVQSQIVFVFDRAILKDGTQIPLHLTVQAIGLPTLSASALADQDPYDPTPRAAGSAAANPTPTPHQGFPPRPISAQPPATPPVGDEDSDSRGRHPGLDAGSHGVVGLPNLTLSESSPTTPAGSVVRAATKNVKLESGTEIVLRVLDQPPNQMQNP